MEKTIDMDKPMAMNSDSNIITEVLTWMPPMGNMWVFSDFFLLFMMWGCDDDSYDDTINSSNAVIIHNA
jgi:hypothetical protein